MNGGFLCEATQSFVRVRFTQALTERILEECQFCMLEIIRRTGTLAVLYDLTEMHPSPISVLLYQRLLNEHVAHLPIRRAIVAPNAQIAHLGRLAFGEGSFRLFYGDIEAAERFLRDASALSSADWGIRVIEERRVRERRAVRREPSSRRRHDHVAH